MKAYGVPAGAKADSAHWRYKGILFLFDGFQRVRRTVLVEG